MEHSLYDVDKEARFQKVYDAYMQDVYRLCFSYMKNKMDTEDAVQETFLRAYKALDTFRGECQEKTWLTSIAINVCRNARKSAWLRRVDRRVTPEQLPVATWDHYDQDAADLAAAIQRLPNKLKEVVLLYYYQEISMPEIAGMIGISPSMVSKRIKKAHEQLYSVLGKEFRHG